MFGFLDMDIFKSDWFDASKTQESKMTDDKPLSTPTVFIPAPQVHSICQFSFQKEYSSSTQKNYNQTHLMKKFNALFQQKNDLYKLMYPNEVDYTKYMTRLIDTQKEGFCWGLAVLWAYEYSQKNAAQFYSRIKDIIDCPDESLMFHHEKILSFFKKIDALSAQAPSYPPDGQVNTPTLLGLARHSLVNIEVSKNEKLLKALSKHAPHDEIILVTGLAQRFDKRELPQHAVALARQKEGYLLFDANNPSLEAVFVPYHQSLLHKLRYALYKFEGVKIKPKVCLELSVWQKAPELKMIESPLPRKPVFFKPSEQSNMSVLPLIDQENEVNTLLVGMKL